MFFFLNHLKIVFGITIMLNREKLGYTIGITHDKATRKKHLAEEVKQNKWKFNHEYFVGIIWTKFS